MTHQFADEGTLAQREFSGVVLPDKRLKDRLLSCVAAIEPAAARSFPSAMRDGTALTGWYRFLHNRRVTAAAILGAHVDESLKRASAHKRFLVLHDTTECRFEGEVVRGGLGPLAGGGHGFYAHVSLAVSDGVERDPLGVMALRTFVRDSEPLTKAEKKKQAQKARPDSESRRWIDAVQEVEGKLSDGMTCVHVADREGDFYELIASMVSQDHRFVVRAHHDRVLERGTPNQHRMSDALSTVETIAEREVHLSRRAAKSSPKDRKKHPPREARSARLAISAMPLELEITDTTKHLDLPRNVSVNVVQVREQDVADGDFPVEWTLLTNLPIDSVADVLDVVDSYRARWMIEELFKALKTGCQFEKRQLEEYDHLVKALAVLLPIAWSLLRLRHLSRAAQQTPATEVLTPTQVEVLRALTKVGLPKKPTVGDALAAVAELGGHIKSNGKPGWQVLGRGFQDLLLLELGWSARGRKM